MAKLKNANECAKYLKSVGGDVGTEIAEKSASKIKKQLKTDSNDKSLAPNEPKTKKEKLNSINADENKKPNNNNKSIKSDKNRNLNGYEDSDENLNSNTNSKGRPRQFKDTSAQTVICSTTQKLVMLNESSESVSSHQDNETSEIADQKNRKKLNKPRHNRLKSNNQFTEDVDDSLVPIYDKNGEHTSRKPKNNENESDLDERTIKEVERRARAETEERENLKKEKRNKNLNAYGLSNSKPSKSNSQRALNDEDIVFEASPERNKNKNTTSNYNSNSLARSTPFQRNNRRDKPKPIYNQYDNFDPDENTVRLIIKGEVIKSATWAKNRYTNLFDRQRLILKSLYEIRRCRINNRDVSIAREES